MCVGSWTVGLVFSMVIGWFSAGLTHTMLWKWLDLPTRTSKRVPTWVTGFVERGFFTVVIAFELTGAAIAMIGWLTLKMVTSWNRPSGTIKVQLINEKKSTHLADVTKNESIRDAAAETYDEVLERKNQAFVALISGLVAMFFAMIGGLIANGKICGNFTNTMSQLNVIIWIVAGVVSFIALFVATNFYSSNQQKKLASKISAAPPSEDTPQP